MHPFSVRRLCPSFPPFFQVIIARRVPSEFIKPTPWLATLNASNCLPLVLQHFQVSLLPKLWIPPLSLSFRAIIARRVPSEFIEPTPWLGTSKCLNASNCLPLVLQHVQESLLPKLWIPPLSLSPSLSSSYHRRDASRCHRIYALPGTSEVLEHLKSFPWCAAGISILAVGHFFIAGYAERGGASFLPIYRLAGIVSNLNSCPRTAPDFVLTLWYPRRQHLASTVDLPFGTWDGLNANAFEITSLGMFLYGPA